MNERRDTGSSLLPPLCLALALTLAVPPATDALPRDDADLILGKTSRSSPRLELSKKTGSAFDLTLTRSALGKPALSVGKATRDGFDGDVKGGSKPALSVGKATRDGVDMPLDRRTRSRPVPKGGKDADDLRMTRGKYQIRDALVTTQRKRLASPDRLGTGKATLDRHDLDLSVTPKNVYHLR